jgi:hypothetical protein
MVSSFSKTVRHVFLFPTTACNAHINKDQTKPSHSLLANGLPSTSWIILQLACISMHQVIGAFLLGSYLAVGSFLQGQIWIDGGVEI